MTSVTESHSNYDRLEKMCIRDILLHMNKEDKKVPLVVQNVIPHIDRLVTVLVEKMKGGGRLFYIGAGTSGRLGILDASEIPPTYGMSGKVIGLIAGGDTAIRVAVEHAEDDEQQAWKDLNRFNIGTDDVLIGISASGKTPYVVGGLRKARQCGVVTGCIVCNTETEIGQHADFPIEVVVGPEFVTGSTRMKAGTVQKLVLNMVSTCSMIKLERVRGNRMVDMQLSNDKLIRRGIRMIREELGVSEQEAERLLSHYGSVRTVLDRGDSPAV